MKENMRFEYIVSVIVPTHNRVEYLIKAVKSVLKQTVSSLEILVCDDGSEDKTREKVAQMTSEDARVKYIYCGNNGCPAIPRNIGILHAKGEWIAFLDDDDSWVENKLELQLEAMAKQHSLASCSNAYCYITDGRISGTYFKNLRNRKYGFYDFALVNPVMCSTAIVHSSLMAVCKGFSTSKKLIVGEDYALWLRIACLTEFVYLNAPLIYYLRTSSSSIRNGQERPFEQLQKDVLDDFEEWSRTIYPEYRNYYWIRRIWVEKLKPIWKIKEFYRKYTRKLFGYEEDDNEA